MRKLVSVLILFASSLAIAGNSDDGVGSKNKLRLQSDIIRNLNLKKENFPFSVKFLDHMANDDVEYKISTKNKDLIQVTTPLKVIKANYPGLLKALDESAESDQFVEL